MHRSPAAARRGPAILPGDFCRTYEPRPRPSSVRNARPCRPRRRHRSRHSPRRPEPAVAPLELPEAITYRIKFTQVVDDCRWAVDAHVRSSRGTSSRAAVGRSCVPRKDLVNMVDEAIHPSFRVYLHNGCHERPSRRPRGAREGAGSARWPPGPHRHLRRGPLPGARARLVGQRCTRPHRQREGSSFDAERSRGPATKELRGRRHRRSQYGAPQGRLACHRHAALGRQGSGRRRRLRDRAPSSSRARRNARSRPRSQRLRPSSPLAMERQADQNIKWRSRTPWRRGRPGGASQSFSSWTPQDRCCDRSAGSESHQA